MTRYSGHSANLRLSIDGVQRMAKFVGDGLIVATAVSPFRPRRWKGALAPYTADFHELFHVVSVTIREYTSTTVELLFDDDHSLEQRIVAEQFLS